MAKEGFPLMQDEEFYEYHNPVTGQEKIFLRKRHDVIRSPRLEAFDACMHDALAGRRYQDGNARADEIAVHEAFTAAVERCKHRDKAYPSDARR